VIKIPNLKTITGSCLCNNVKITAPNISSKVWACHCTTCRGWGGGPFLSVDCGTDVAFEGEENISVYDSSKWAERGFCKQCGTHLFYRIKENQQYAMPVGLFDKDENFEFDIQVFIDEKPEYYCFSNETRNLTGAEAFAEFAP